MAINIAAAPFTNLESFSQWYEHYEDEVSPSFMFA